VKVDDAALELGHLGERRGQVLAQLGARHAEPAAKLPALPEWGGPTWEMRFGGFWWRTSRCRRRRMRAALICEHCTIERDERSRMRWTRCRGRGSGMTPSTGSRSIFGHVLGARTARR